MNKKIFGGSVSSLAFLDGSKMRNGITQLIIMTSLLFFSTSGFTQAQIPESKRENIENTSNVHTKTNALTETTATRKFRNNIEISDWAKQYFADQSVNQLVNGLAGGFPAVYFFVKIDGQSQRGVAVDYGENVLYHLSTDLEASNDDLTKAVLSKTDLLNEYQARLASSYDPCNCTSYAKSLVPSLPSGLSNMTGKQNIVNDYFPRVGSVGIHPYAPVGHVSVLKSVAVRAEDGELIIKITEANYVKCKVTERTGTETQLKIIGYYSPLYPARSSSRSDYNAPKLERLSVSSIKRNTPVDVIAYGNAFATDNLQVIILGGRYCDSFGKCVVPNSVIRERSSTNIKIPLTLNNPGTYRIYIFNVNSGQTSNGKPIVVN